jgi:hypothetical protein
MLYRAVGCFKPFMLVRTHDLDYSSVPFFLIAENEGSDLPLLMLQEASEQARRQQRL